MSGHNRAFFGDLCKKIYVILQESVIVKRIDDTPTPENESEVTVEAVLAAMTATMATFRAKIESLELRIANLETQRTPEMENDDPEWFS